jgi:hypothetical protein
VEAKSILQYFSFGAVVRYLQDVHEDQPIHGDSYVLANITRFLRAIKDLNLQVTDRAAFELTKYYDELKQTDKTATLTGEQADTIVNIVHDLRKTLHAELQGFDAYVVTPKRIDVEKLLSNVGGLLAPDVFDSLPTIAQFDFEEAGKCIAFERPTAAAFHLLRATESVLRDYYRSMVKQKRVKVLLWGPIVTHLRKVQKMKGKTALLNNLDNIRVSFRNPTQHPDKVYDIQEAQDLWSLCVEVINRMVADLQKG